MASVMSTYFKAGHSIRSCNAICYDATKEECNCICGGINHGKGFEKAHQNVAEAHKTFMEAFKDMTTLKLWDAVKGKTVKVIEAKKEEKKAKK